MLFQVRGTNKLKVFLKKCRPPWGVRRNFFWFLEALKTADWRSRIKSFGNDTKIDLYVDKISHKEVSIPSIKNYRSKNIWLGKKSLLSKKVETDPDSVKPRNLSSDCFLAFAYDLTFHFKGFFNNYKTQQYESKNLQPWPIWQTDRLSLMYASGKNRRKSSLV